jgi:hypothetical protein
MRNFFVTLIAYLALLQFACQDTREDSKNEPFDNTFYKNVGKEIPFEVGMRWLNTYRTKQNIQGRTGALYSVSALQFNTMLLSVLDLTGVAYHYGLDAAGTTHIILIPIDGSLSLWSAIPGRIFIDANTGLPISQSTAQAWANNYKSIHPDEIWFHFFGKNIFDEITSLLFFNSMDIEPALNDEGEPQILLIVWNSTLPLLGRTTGQQGVV